jgi:hypothetical protein
MLVAMVPAVTTFNAASLLHIAEEDHSEDKPYAKVNSYRIKKYILYERFIK